MINPITYHNANKFPDGIYQNSDIVRDQGIFAKVQGDDLYLGSAAQAAKDGINLEIYFRPSYIPIPYMYDYRLGSCFSGWVLPTASYQFQVDKESITVSVLPNDISIGSYLEFAHVHIEQSIKKIYQNNPKVCLHYSGGIDSLVILSYLEKMDLLSRTHLVYFRNLTQQHKDVSFTDAELWAALLEMFEKMKTKAAGCDIIDITVRDIADRANSDSWSDLTCYTTATVMKKYPGFAHLHGHLGNTTMLHFHHFNDEIIRHKNNHQEFETAQKSQDNYSSYLSHHVPKIQSDIVPIRDRHIGPKLYRYLGNNHHPLGDDVLLEKIRRLKCDDLLHEDIFKAAFARDIIRQNAKGEFDSFVIRGCQNETNALVDIEVPLDLIDPNILHIPENQWHHPEGVRWLEYELQQSRIKKHIPINVLVSVLAQKKIRSMTGSVYNY